MSNLQNPIRIYDASLNLVSEMDNYQSAYFTRSWYGVGDFSIQTNANMPHATDLQKGYFVMFGKDKYRFGLITALEQRVDQDGKGSEIITASGFEVKFMYSWRIMLPPTGDDYYTLSGVAETVMKTLVKDQCGSTAIANRQFSLQTIATDLARGSAYNLNSRYNATVADELQKISLDSDLGYLVYFDETTKKFVFDIGVGLDRSDSQSVNPRAIFSKDFDTLREASFVTSDNQYRNYSYTAGQGVGAARNVREVYNTTTEPTDMERKEIYVDARDLALDANLDKRSIQKLSECAIQLTVDGSPLTYSPLIYRTDYDLGDIVTVTALGASYDARITTVKESWAPLAYDINLTFDKEAASLTTQVNRAVESVKSNLASTEGYIVESATNTYGKFIRFTDASIIYTGDWVDLSISSSLSGASIASSFIKRMGDEVRIRLAFTVTPQTITNGNVIFSFTSAIKIDGSSALVPQRYTILCDTTTLRHNATINVNYTSGTASVYFADGVAQAGSVSNVKGFYADIYSILM